MVKNIFCVQKVKKEVLSAEIPVVSSMELMKQMMRKAELGSTLAAAVKSNVNREAIYNESFVEGMRIPKASSMVIMKELGKQLRHQIKNRKCPMGTVLTNPLTTVENFNS